MSKIHTEGYCIRFGETTWKLSGEGIDSIRRTAPAVDDLAEAIDAAFCQPYGFTRLDQAIVPGDLVALAVDPATPSLSPLIAGIAVWLVEHGTDPQNLRVVLSDQCQQAELLHRQLRETGLGSVSLELHNPEDPQQISYVAADEDAHPIYVNRSLVDADVVLPISCARSRQAFDYLGPFGIFPHFSNRETQGRLQDHLRRGGDEHRKLSQTQVQQAAWWLGLLIGVKIVPTAEDRVAGIVCGLLDEIDLVAQRLMLGGLSEPDRPDRSHDLVIAVLDAQHQDWSQAARALHHAQRLCALGGTIVLCTDLAEPFGKSPGGFSEDAPHVESIEGRTSADRYFDALAAAVFQEVTQDHHVYLVSKHPPDTIEEMGLGVITDSRQLSALIARLPKSLILHSAHHP